MLYNVEDAFVILLLSSLLLLHFHFYLLQALFYYLFRFNTYFPANIPAPTTFLLQECNENIFTDIIAVPGTINVLSVVMLPCVF